jgi:hypothetical protein
MTTEPYTPGVMAPFWQSHMRAHLAASMVFSISSKVTTEGTELLGAGGIGTEML